MISEYELLTYRRYFPFLSKGIIYLNHAATGPLSKCVVQEIHDYLIAHSQSTIDTYKEDRIITENVRTMIAQLLNAESPDSIALVQNTSEGINIVANGLQWKEGDRIVVFSEEFPANVVPFFALKRKGVRVDIVPTNRGAITIDLLQEYLQPRTKLLALSAVHFLSGYKADLENIGALCRKEGIWFFVDAIQAVGAIPIDVRTMFIDALACGGQKWVMAPQGVGFLYVSERLHKVLQPPFVGWLSVQNPWDFFNYNQPHESSARRYEIGTLNYAGIRGLYQSLLLLSEVGISNIHKRLQELTSILVDELSKLSSVNIITPLSPHQRAGIVTVERTDGKSFKEAYQHLLDNHVIVSLRDEKLRFSPHFYNSVDELQKVISILKQFTQA